MKKVISTGIWTILVMLTSSCGHKLSSNAYIQFMQDRKNGLLKIIDANKLEYSIQYKPHDYIILLENKGNNDANSIDKRRANLKGTAWFNISFKLIDEPVSPLRYGVTSKSEYDARLNYFLNNAAHFIRLIYGAKDTLLPVAYEFENGYNLTPQETMVVGFSLPDGEPYPRKDMQITYADNVFKSGIVKARYKEEDLDRIPKLIN